MTAKDLKNKGGVERGVTREQRAIKRRKKLEASLLSSGSDGHGMKRMSKSLADFNKKECAIEEERFGSGGLPDREVPIIPFKEKPFGDEVKGGQELCRSSVVSLALFDGDCAEENMLFACSGITLPHGSAIQGLTRFVTSACLVREFNLKRNRDDNLRIQVRLPDNTTEDGLLGLYDEDIAIVTSMDCLHVDPVDLDLQASPDHPDGHVLAAGRAFNSGSLMAMRGSLSNESPNIFLSDSQGFTEAALGGPLVGNDERFHGMIVDLCHDVGENRKCAKFLSRKSLCQRLELFQILNPKKLHFYGYSLPSGVSSVVPSGFMKTIYRLRSFGYPMPPPLVLEFNGELLDRFEDRFGELRAWNGYPFGDLPNDRWERVWVELEKKVVTKISRRVVSLASFNRDYSRSFACTGLLIMWPGSRAKRTVVLTSASLVRSRDNEGNIDRNLRIEVFLPPNQRRDGTLELCNLHKNIAIVSFKKGFKAIHPEDIFNEGMQESSSEKVVALGRDPIHGLLMGTIGKVKRNYKDRKLECQELRCSTCKIKKVGIGGPLIDFHGTFVGMNFYDGRDLTPFLPRDKVVDALKGSNNFILPSERFILPSESGSNPVSILDPQEKENRWPVPEPYWYHGALDEDMDDVPELMGRTLL
ncbi:uncharacterized protein [Miscanthus floridulus]|uniref:uncharacterized protein isoform X2 n=1 Tax=Miscanthus floridulus TaxID=154761 RepID=UPI0034585E4E